MDFERRRPLPCSNRRESCPKRDRYCREGSSVTSFTWNDLHGPLGEVDGCGRDRGTSTIKSTTRTSGHGMTNEVSQRGSHAYGSSHSQDGLGIIGNTIAFSPVILHVSEHLVASWVRVVHGGTQMSDPFKPVRYIVTSSSRAQWCGTLGTEGRNVRDTRRYES